MGMAIESPAALLRLLQLSSPSLPVGAFAYSQGLEWAVETGWVSHRESLERWLTDQLEQALTRVDLALLLRMMRAADAEDLAAMARWIDELLALRETAELRREEQARGRALAELIESLGLLDRPCRTEEGKVDGSGAAMRWKAVIARAQLAGLGFAAARWSVDPPRMLFGYAWSWAENLTLAAVKLVPLGQTTGQQVLAQLAILVPTAVEQALTLEDDDLGASSPALAIASSCHETQYTRLFRS